MMQTNHPGSQRGQGMAEYSLIAASIIIVSLGGLFLLGNSIGNTVESMLPGYSKPPAPLTPPNANPLPGAPAVVAANGMQGSPASNAQGSLSDTGILIKTATGAVIEIPSYPKDVSKSILTMGANGTTDILANTIQLAATKLFSTGEITQSQYNALVSLANQGHYLGKLADSLESAGMNTSGNSFNETTVTVDGEQMSVYDVAQLIGLKNADYDSQPPSNPLNSDAYPGLQKFSDLYQKAVQSGALSDPVINTIVSSAASNIANINVALDYAGQKLASNSIAPGDITSQVASLVSHQNAATICQAGKGEDSGITCK